MGYMPFQQTIQVPGAILTVYVDEKVINIRKLACYLKKLLLK